MRARVVCGVWLTLAATAWAQVSRPGTGTVTGHVICGDTQKPARFVNVMLFGVPAAVTVAPSKFDASDPKKLQALIKSQIDAMNSVSFVQTETGIDGSFVAPDVPPGNYYLMASVPGYVHPQALVEAANDAGEDLTKGITGMPLVHVAADRTTEANVSVSRGAAAEGHVQWDDGSPLTGAIVQAEPPGQHKDLPPQFAQMRMNDVLNGLTGITDDKGRYRISGLAPGEYRIRVTLQTNLGMSVEHGRMNPFGRFGSMPLVVYAPGAFRRSAAKPLTLSAGEERTDEDITFDLGSTHTVSGRVTSAEDHHGLSRGTVELTDADDKTFSRSAGLDADGNFSVTFVPAGTYTISVENAADAAPEEAKSDSDTKSDGPVIFGLGKVARSYQKAERQVIVTDNDVTGQNFELKPDKPGNADEAGDGN